MHMLPGFGNSVVERAQSQKSEVLTLCQTASINVPQAIDFLQICLPTSMKMEDWFMCMASKVNYNSEIL